MSDIEFIDGLNAKAPRENEPDFVIGSLSIKREALIAWLQKRDGEWINADIKEAKSGKWYVAVDNWKPNSAKPDSAPRQQRQAPAPAPSGDASNGFPDDDDIPFAPIPRRAYF